MKHTHKVLRMWAGFGQLPTQILGASLVRNGGPCVPLFYRKRDALQRFAKVRRVEIVFEIKP